MQNATQQERRRTPIATEGSRTDRRRPAQEDLSGLFPQLNRDHAAEDMESRLRREYLEARSERDVDRRERARLRLIRTTAEFIMLFVGTHWLFHGLTGLTFALNFTFAIGLAFAVERWFIGRSVAAFHAALGYVAILCFTGVAFTLALTGSVVFISCGMQMLRLTRESEWQGV